MFVQNDLDSRHPLKSDRENTQRLDIQSYKNEKCISFYSFLLGSNECKGRTNVLFDAEQKRRMHEGRTPIYKSYLMKVL